VRVFVLCTGRTASTTIIRAFEHATNFTAGHETRSAIVDGRLDYPDAHIEADNRLAWFLGSLDRQYGGAPCYVHLTRDPTAVQASFVRRWEELIESRKILASLRRPRETAARARAWLADPTAGLTFTIIRAFGHGVLQCAHPFDDGQRQAVARLYVKTINDNIELFLRNKPHVERVRVEHLEADFETLWTRIGATGDLDRARHELSVRHNHKGSLFEASS
jgi:hypothetical protein